MKKCFFIFGIFLLFISIKPVNAQSFKQEVVTEYVYELNGDAHVKQLITIITNESDSYPTQFQFEVDADRTSNIIARMGDQILEYSIEPSSESSNLAGVVIKFPSINEVSKETKFELQYRVATAAIRKGNLVELNIPLTNQTHNSQSDMHTVIVHAPMDWGNLQIASITPSKIEQSDSYTNLSFDPFVNQVDSVLQLSFGHPQVYNLELKYQLSNQEKKEALQVVAFPPQLEKYQEVYVSHISLEPDKIETDPDGNFLAYYKVKPGEVKEITFTGQAVIGNSDLELKTDPKKLANSQRYLIADEYWEVNDQKISELANQFKSPEEVYNFVVSHLQYNQNKVEGTQIERFGALRALDDPANAACMEFTDLTIALMRSLGIPAREVDGYVYLTEDQKLIRPAVSDVLHAWVQYWDEERGWVNIDPTWGDSSGRDYFNHFDFDHVIFVMKGISSKFPYPAGAYRLTGSDQQNVVVELGEADQPTGISLSDWFSEYKSRHLPWWQKLWNWIWRRN
jgi:hypothetical protein